MFMFHNQNLYITRCPSLRHVQSRVIDDVSMGQGGTVLDEATGLVVHQKFISQNTNNTKTPKAVL
jgi:hypothetical protein